MPLAVPLVAGIHHFTVRCTPGQLEAVRHFYRDVLGMREGARPGFDFPGAWMHVGEVAIVHIAAIVQDGPEAGASQGPGFDHVALHGNDFAGVRRRLDALGTAYEVMPVPGWPLRQIFLQDPTGARIELTFDLPQPRIAFAEADGVRTAYRQQGEGPLLLLIHGAEADHTMFLGLMEELAADFTVVAYDQRDSGRTANGEAPYGLDELAGDAAGLIRALAPTPPGRCHVFGTSFGGQIAQVLAARHPEVVDRLVLGSTWRTGRPVTEVNPAAVQAIGALRADLGRNAPAIASYFLTEDYLRRHPEALDIFRGQTRSDAQKQRRAQMLARPCDADPATITAPTLLLAGTADRLIPPEATFELADAVAGAKCLALPGLPHIGALESPRHVAAAIRDFIPTPPSA